MSDTFLYNQLLPTTLYGSGAVAGDATLILTNFHDLDGNDLTMADFGTLGYGTIEPGTSGQEEAITFSGITQNLNGTATLTGVKHQLTKAPYTQTSGLGTAHAGGVIFVISNTAGFYDSLSGKNNDETINGVYTFTKQPISTAGLPVNPTDLSTKQYVDNTATGTTAINRTVVSGVAGAIVSAGNLVYYDAVTTKQWLKADSSATAKSENVLLGIAQGAGTAGNPITNGVLIFGFDANQTGMSAGNVMYLTDTPGVISNTHGTLTTCVGIAYSATQLYFNPRFNQQIIQAKIDALAGTNGTPSGSNKYVTASGLAAQLAIYTITVFGGTGADGALSVPSGTTTLNLGQIYNYTTINVANGATLAFTGTGAALLNATGAVTIAGTIELRGLVATKFGGSTTRHSFESGSAYVAVTAPSGTGGTGGTSPNSGSYHGGNGGNSGDAGIGLGGTANDPGNPGQGGATSVTGGGGGGGGGAGTAGAQSTNNNGGAGGNGGSDRGGGAGGGGRLSGNGGNGGAAGDSAAGYGSNGGGGGDSGSTGGNGGNGGAGSNGGGGYGGNGGVGGVGYAAGGAGGAAGTGFATHGGYGGNGGNALSGNGGAGGIGGAGSNTGVLGGYGGNGGNSRLATGGAGGVGGAGGATSGVGGAGGNGGNGRTGGVGGAGGAGTGSGNGGAGGNGGSGLAGSSPFILYTASTLTINSTAVFNAHGGDGAIGGDGGTTATGVSGSGGNGGDGGRGSDIIIVSLGVATINASATFNNLGGSSGKQGSAGQITSTGKYGTAGKVGNKGIDGKLIIQQINLI